MDDPFLIGSGGDLKVRMQDMQDHVQGDGMPRLYQLRMTRWCRGNLRRPTT
jgi:hypothetical protein